MQARLARFRTTGRGAALAPHSGDRAASRASWRPSAPRIGNHVPRVPRVRLGARSLFALACALLVLLPAIVAAELSAEAYARRQVEDARARALAGLDSVAGLIDLERTRASNNAELAAVRVGRPAQDGASSGLVQALADLRGPLRTSLVALVDGGGRTIASDPASNLPFGTMWEARQAIQGKVTVGLQDRAPGLAVQAAAPLRADGDIIPGAVVVAQAVDDGFLNSALRVTGLEAAIVQNGRLVAASRGLRRSFAYATDQSIDGDLPAAGPDRFKRTRLGSEGFYLAARTLRAGDRELGALLVGLSADAGDDAAFQARALAASAAVLGGLAAGALGWWGGQRLTAQVDTVARRVRALGGEQADRRAARASATGYAAGRDVPAVFDSGRDVSVGSDFDRDVPFAPVSGRAGSMGVGPAGSLWRELDAAIDDAATAVRQRLDDQRVRAARLESTLASLAEGVIVADEQHRVVLANPAARTLLGLPLVGEVPSLEQVPAMSPEDGRGDWRADGLGESRANERVIRSYAATVLDAAGATLGYVTVLRDATREQEVERLKSEFLSTVSHELQTPLTAVKGALELVVEDETGRLSRVQRKYLDTIDRNCARLIGLVGDLLDLSRLDAGRVQLDARPIDAASVVGGCVAALANLFDRGGITVRVDIAPETPPLLGDRRRVEQILTNLLANAAKYTPRGGVVDVSARGDDGHVAIAVADSGPGIPAAERALVFDRFYRGRDALRRGEAGSGLGLAIVKSLTELHDGSVGVEEPPPDAPVRGARFVVRLPRAPEDDRQAV